MGGQEISGGGIEEPAGGKEQIVGAWPLEDIAACQSVAGHYHSEKWSLFPHGLKAVAGTRGMEPASGVAYGGYPFLVNSMALTIAILTAEVSRGLSA